VSINYAQLIVQAADAQGHEGALLGSDTWDNNMVIESAKGTDLECFVTTFYQEGGNKEFDEGIKKWINENADAKTNDGGNDMVAAVTAMGYDAYFTALEALKAAKSPAPADVLAALPGVNYDGVSGNIQFDDIGDAVRDSAFIKTANTEDGVWDFVKVQTVG
jgi:branched-chain amino acid transport system substrate-binding protein